MAKTSPAVVPQAHEGAHYPNPSTRPLVGPVAPTERDGVQRGIWRLFFVLVLCLLAMGVAFSFVFRHRL